MEESDNIEIMEDINYKVDSMEKNNLRHRIPWSDRVSLSNDIPSLNKVKEMLEDDVTNCLADDEEEDGIGCPFPSTPEDDHLLDCEVLIKQCSIFQKYTCYQTNLYIFLYQMTEVLKAGVLSDEIDLGAFAHNAAEQAEEFVRKVM